MLNNPVVETFGMVYHSCSHIGNAADILTCAIIVPILPYRLQDLGYSDISTLTSWILLAYSGGIVSCTLPVSYIFHRHPYRRWPLVGAVIGMLLAMVLFMLGKLYLMRYGSEHIYSRSLQYSGVDGGLLPHAPPIAGALYDRLGWNAPFISCIIVLSVDLLLRLFVLERSDIRKFHEKPLFLRPGTLKARLVDGRIVTSDDQGFKDVGFTELTKAEQDTLYGVELKPWEVLGASIKSPRGMTAFASIFVYGLIGGALQPTLTLRVQERWNRNSEFVGLIYLAAAAPTLIAGPIVGALSDKFGAEMIMLPCMILLLPWPPLLLLRNSLAELIVYSVFVNLFSTCAMNPSGLEATMVARNIQGVSEIHQFGAMEIAFGTLAGGQFYHKIPNHQGWTAVIWFIFGVSVVVMPMMFCLAGEPELTLAMRLFGRWDWNLGQGIEQREKRKNRHESFNEIP
ncbi:hypothetical protein L198_04610 [Cryptococcus wingfieldii CBS 7118]|uniref:Major facilitator superfamily (MFS) profile domain-containing protein n=1 Tax=Cryptococcus wingfieldii CBS 7118 TaxID=1295528 RepID=A0A1E3J2Z8_9TREE|nr:hypothetical protein L198_04610 [Cryptococcus wingfieldii CBS 7118]ODN95222.1 hypothetical protein L198_04610 [Cryptococcus wingfieldii CBS 7118]